MPEDMQRIVSGNIRAIGIIDRYLVPNISLADSIVDGLYKKVAQNSTTRACL